MQFPQEIRAQLAGFVAESLVLRLKVRQGAIVCSLTICSTERYSIIFRLSEN